MKRKLVSVLLAAALVMGNAGFAFADTEYTVVQDDWLSKIAERYGATYQELAEYNGIANPDLIFPGQIIKIPDGSPAPASPEPTAPEPEPPAPAPEPAPLASADTDYDRYLDALDVKYSEGVADFVSAQGSDPATGFRTSGSSGELAVADYLYGEFQKIGLKNVKKEAMTVDNWEYKGGKLVYTDADGKEQTAILGGFATTIKADNETVDVVYAGTGREADYDGLDAKGKLVMIDVDQYDDYWISKPAYEAHLHGAKAVLAVPVGGYGQANENVLSVQDICGPADAPAFNITVKDANALKALIDASPTKSVSVKLTADSKVTNDGTSYNIVGEIPGKNTDEIIFIMAHYDGYFHAWHDNGSGLGAALGITKAIIDSGYQPDKTLILVAHGSEEYGLEDSRYDWAIGSYRQIMVNHPEWQDMGFAALNMESGIARNDDSSFLIKSTYEFNSAVSRFAAEYDGPKPQNPGANIKVQSPTTTWTEDYSYALTGIPTLVHSRENRNFSESSYHSNYDLKDSSYSPENYEYAMKIYGKIYMSTDALAVMPLDYTARFEALKEIAEGSYGVEYPSASAASAKADEAIATAERLNEKIETMNAAYAKAVAAENEADTKEILTQAKALNKNLRALNKETYNNFSNLDWADVVVFPSEPPLANIAALNAAVAALEEGDAATALDEYLWQIDDNYSAYGMSRENYDYFIWQTFGQSDDRQAWGAQGIQHGNLDLFDAIKGLIEKHESGQTEFGPEIAAFKAGVTDQEQKLNELAAQEQTDLQRFTDGAEALLK
jgi:murein DD-endopeptidase MepM/ murein hydrolase activator NlpD